MTTLATANFNDALPAAPAGRQNVKWQADSPTANPRDISAHMPNLGGVDARTTAIETISLASQGKLVTFSNGSATAVTLDSAGMAAGFFCAFENLGVGALTLTPSSGSLSGVTNPVATGSGGWLFFDGTNWEAVTGGGGGASPVGFPYNVSLGFVDNPSSSQAIGIHTFTETVNFLGNFGGSEGTVGVNPGSSQTYSVTKNGSSIGTIVIGTTGSVSFTTSGGSPVSFSAGDRLAISAPGSADASLKLIAVTLAGQRASTSGTPYVISSAFAGVLAASQVVGIHTFTQAVSFAGNFAGSYGSVGSNPTATQTFTVAKNGSSIGTIAVSTGGVVTFTTTAGAAQSFVAGDRLSITGPASPDISMSDLGFSLAGTR